MHRKKKAVKRKSTVRYEPILLTQHTPHELLLHPSLLPTIDLKHLGLQVYMEWE